MKNISDKTENKITLVTQPSCLTIYRIFDTIYSFIIVERSNVMSPDNIVAKICAAVDCIIQTGKDYNGLFPSILHPKNGKMLMEKPAKIPGQRNGDRAHLGSNLIHDEPLLATMNTLAETESKPAYTEAVDQYLNHFAQNCTITESGLFPWGEHSYWHLTEERVGCSRNPAGGAAIHDHLRQIPLWIWQKLESFNPICIQSFADGLDYHWTEGEGLEYIRHANIDTKEHLVRGGRSCDFPRHSGFYISDLVFAYTKDQRPETLQQIKNYTNYWWEKRDERGLLRIESRSPKDAESFFEKNAPTQTLSLGISLLESATLLESLQPEYADQMRQYGMVYIDGFLAAPHNLETREFVSMCECRTNRPYGSMSAWGSVYGSGTVGSTGVLCLGGWKQTKNERLMECARAIGSIYLDEKFPVDRVHTEGFKIPASDAGLVLELFADLYDITSETKWLDGGMELAKTVMDVYFSETLPYGASAIDWYESQMGPAFLIHGLARVALMKLHGTCALVPNYTAR